MEQEAVFKLARQRVDFLRVALGAQSRYHQRLGFATCEQGGAVGAGQHAVADFDGAHGAGVATVNARLASQNLAAHNACFDFKQQVIDFDFVKLHALRGQIGFNGCIGFAQSLRARLLAVDLVGSAQFVFCQRGDFADKCFVFRLWRPSAVLLPQGFAGIANQVVNGVDGDFALLVAKHHGAQHHVFAELLGFRFHHQHGRFSACHNQIQLAVFARGLTGVEHIFAVDIAHARSANGTMEGNARHAQRCAHRDHGGDVGIHFRVEREGVHYHVHFVVEPFGEQRANGAVNQTAGECFQLAGFGFTFEEVARNAACGIGFFDVINGQREEILPGLGRFAGHNGCQHHGAVHIQHDCAGGLAGDFAGFHAHRMLAPLEGFGDFVEHRHDVYLL